ncbi:porin [Alcaligenaceae bacterium]|nr:porin [Alcaligenaceae bacterium]
MKSYLIGVFVLSSLACSVSAQTTAQVYGRLDASVVGLNGAQSQIGMVEGVGATSNVGFRGNEDLGGGRSVIYNLEIKIELATGGGGAATNSGTYRSTSNGIFSRNAYAGLKDKNLGTLTLGRNYTSAVRAVYNMNAIPVGINTGLAGNIAAQGIGNDFWNNNQIKYDSPEFGGLSFMANYAPSEGGGASSRGTNYGGSATYRSSGLVLTAGHQKDNNHIGPGSINWSVLTASYAIGDVKVAGGYVRVKNPSKIAGWTDSKMWTVGAAYKITPPLTLGAQYFNNKESNTGTTSKQLVINARYALSKRTGLYAMATRTENGAMPVMAMYNVPGTANGKTTAMAVGIQHFF